VVLHFHFPQFSKIEKGGGEHSAERTQAVLQRQLMIHFPQSDDAFEVCRSS